MTECFADLSSTLQSRVAELKELVCLRSRDQHEDIQAEANELNKLLFQIEESMDSLELQIKSENTAIADVEELCSLAKQQSVNVATLHSISSRAFNSATRHPSLGNASAGNERSTSFVKSQINSTPSASTSTTSSSFSVMSSSQPHPPSPPSAHPASKIPTLTKMPPMFTVTAEEFEEVPMYQRRGLTLEKLKKGIQDIFQFLSKKQKLLCLPISKLNNEQLRLYKAYKDQECEATRNLLWFCEADLKHFQYLKNDATSRRRSF